MIQIYMNVLISLQTYLKDTRRIKHGLVGFWQKQDEIRTCFESDFNWYWKILKERKKDFDIFPVFLFYSWCWAQYSLSIYIKKKTCKRIFISLICMKCNFIINRFFSQTTNRNWNSVQSISAYRFASVVDFYDVWHSDASLHCKWKFNIANDKV